MKDVQEKLTLGIETSCDETSAAVLRGTRELLSCVIATQIPIHQKYGGVVPEIASRNHILSILPVIEQALAEAGTELAEIDQIAVTYGPGLVGALLVGVSAAVAEKDGDNSVDEQKVDGRVREFGGRRFCPFCSLLRGDFAFGVCFCAGFNF